jgi:hypothetical protein
MLVPYDGRLFALPFAKLSYTIECNFGTAFVRIDAKWKNIAKFDSDCLFVLPLSGVVRLHTAHAFTSMHAHTQIYTHILFIHT